MEANDSPAFPLTRSSSHEEIPRNSENVGELIQKALEVSYEADMTLAYSSEKLANLGNLLLQVITGESDFGTIDVEKDDDISAELSEKAFTFDLLCAILNFELKELDNLMVDLQGLVVDALRMMSSGEDKTGSFNGLVSKLHDSEELIKQTKERISEMKIQLAKLQITSFSSKQHEWKNGLVMGVKGELIIRMLEKSLLREMELEKKLTEVRQNEEDLKLKLRLTEQVAVFMEEAAEVASCRFLEADNTAEILMGISKEMMGKLQIVHFNLSSSAKREELINYKLQDCINQLNAREALIPELNNTISQLLTDNAEVKGLREKVQMLEEKLRISESRLEEANASREIREGQLKELDGEIESLREKMYAAENRAENAEERAAHLTDSNLELTEEIDFLKGTNDNNTKKVSVLEKQLRELDIQLQHSRALSEASQEQQNNLYSAIWDMETLIDELKQNVAKAESKTETAEERCVILSETNLEISKELEFLRSRMEFMEKSLEQAALEKQSCAKDISIRTSLIMDTVMQLAVERERITKQVFSLAKENKLLRGLLQKQHKNASVVLKDTRSNEKEFLLSGLDSVDSESEGISQVKANEIPSVSFKVENSSEDAPKDETEAGSSTSAHNSTNSLRKYIFVAIVVMFISFLAARFLRNNLIILKFIES